MVEQSLRKGEVGGSTPLIGSPHYYAALPNTMTRLDQTRRKKYYSQLGLYFLLFILIIIFFSTIGLKLLINTSLFVADLQHKPKQAENYGDLLVPPDITDIPDATNSAQITISGRAIAQKNLSVFVNDEKQKDLITDDNGFSTEITLNQGDNAVYVELTDEVAKSSKKSPVYKVTYNNKKPKLDVTAPTDHQIVNKDSFDVTGSTDHGISVKVNGNPIVVGADGSFTQNITLIEGDNTIRVEVHDNAGNSDSKNLTVTYKRD